MRHAQGQPTKTSRQVGSLSRHRPVRLTGDLGDSLDSSAQWTNTDVPIAIRPPAPTDDVWLLVPQQPTQFKYLHNFERGDLIDVSIFLVTLPCNPGCASEQVLRATRDPVTISTAACVCQAWNCFAQEPAVWADADVGATVRRYVMHHRCNDRDRAVTEAGRTAMAILKCFRAFRTWRNVTAHSEQTPPLDRLEHVWAPPSSGHARAEAGYGRELTRMSEKLTEEFVHQISLDTGARTLGYLAKVVLAKNAGIRVANVSCGCTELINGTEADFDEEQGEGSHARNLSMTLAEWGVAGTLLDIDDDASDTKLRLIVYSCQQDQENSIPTITLKSRLAFQRARGRAAIGAARRLHCSETVSPWPRGVPLPPQDQPFLYSMPVYSSPEDAVFEQDPDSQRLADVALLWCAGSRQDRLSRLVTLDLSGLGVSTSLVARVCTAARSTKSLKAVKLDYCAMLDHPRNNEQTNSRAVYNELRATLAADGVSISDTSDTVHIQVVGEHGGCVPFKQPGRRRLKTLFAIYSVRQGRDFLFYYKQCKPDTQEAEVQLQPSDSPRQIGMIPRLASDIGEHDTSSDGELRVTILARRLGIP